MRPTVTLTFDNGPTHEVTPTVLDCLARHKVRSTFFPIGTKAAQPVGASMLHRVHAEGHWIGNHTFTHRTPLGELDAVSAVQEVERAEEILSWVDQPHRLFRPFGRAGRLGQHLLHPAAIEKLTAGKYTCVLWNCVPGDWKDADGWMDRAIAHCLAHPWSLVVLHDTASGAMAHLSRFLDRLEAEGAEFRQDFPPECLPIVDGRAVLSLEPYVNVEHPEDLIHPETGTHHVDMKHQPD